MTTAMIQAGGESARMRRTLGPTHKALLPVLGCSLLERSLCQLLAAGIRDIYIVTSQAEPAIAEYVATRGLELASARGARLQCLTESRPLGTIGAASLLHVTSHPLLVIYADNLTSLDYRMLVDHHKRTQAAMTLAVHGHPFQIPFGEVVARDGRIEDYLEKSVRTISISSGIYVLGPQALAQIPADERCQSPDLVHRLLSAGAHVAEFRHQALWIDVNDSLRLDEAELLVAKNPQQMEHLAATPDQVRWINLALRDNVLHQDVSNTRPAGDSNEIASFDEIDTPSGQIVRWHVLLEIPPSIEFTTAAAVGPSSCPTSGPAARALAYMGYHLKSRA